MACHGEQTARDKGNCATLHAPYNHVVYAVDGCCGKVWTEKTQSAKALMRRTSKIALPTVVDVLYHLV